MARGQIGAAICRPQFIRPPRHPPPLLSLVRAWWRNAGRKKGAWARGDSCDNAHPSRLHPDEAHPSPLPQRTSCLGDSQSPVHPTCTLADALTCATPRAKAESCRKVSGIWMGKTAPMWPDLLACPATMPAKKVGW